MSGTILVVTHFPSPYQIEFFDQISQQRPGTLAVAYLHRVDKDRQWGSRELRHHAIFLTDDDGLHQCEDLNDSAALVIYNYYQDQRSLQLMRVRARSGKPWVFWGERPGFRYEWLGRITRRFALRSLHESKSPIWGIGGWAVDAYRREFGNQRAYVNLPYFSNLDRYAAMHSVPRAEPVLFVFTGSLTYRKGVDLLADAFVRLSKIHPHVRLRVVGNGDLESRLRDLFAPVASQVELTGFKDWKDAPTAYAGGHVLCAPSRHDGWALVVPEALSAGLPVIGTNRTGAAIDLITAGRNGWLVDAGDASSLFNAMQSAAGLSREQWTAMSEAARCSVASHSLAAGATRFLDAADRAKGGVH